MPNSRPRVLVTEDVRAISLRITRALEAGGYESRIARDGEECLARIPEFRPDLLILDLMMPKLNGMDVLKRLRADPETQNLPVIICTAKDFTTEMNLVRELGVVDVIIKPFDPETFSRTVDTFFGRQNALAPPPLSLPPAPLPEYSPVLDPTRPHVRLWGTRGSIPISGPRCLRHGGNTSCMEFSMGEQRLLFDAGSGLREAGFTFLSQGPQHIHLFITHTHWDHIQGFPFFAPIYMPGYKITVYGERGFGRDFESLLSGQLDGDYFPVQRKELRAQLEFRFLDDNPVRIGDITVAREFANHPGATVGFRIEAGGRKVAYVPDNEFLQGYTGSPNDLTRSSDLVMPQLPLVYFLANVDLLLHEAQYPIDEYRTKIGWGHSNLANACALTKLSGVRKWIVLHHDPMHDDEYLGNKLNLTRRMLREMGHPIEVQHGYDGMVEYV